MRKIREIKWCGEEIRKFLNLYRNQPCLWDNNATDYLNREAKKVAIQNLMLQLDELGLPIEEEQLRKKIKSIRDTYRAELYKVMKSTKSGIGYYPKLTWYSTADVFLNAPVAGRQIIPTKMESSSDDHKSTAKTELEAGTDVPFIEEDGCFIDENTGAQFTVVDADGGAGVPYTEAVSTSHITDYADQLLSQDCSPSPSTSLFPPVTNQKRCADETGLGLQTVKRTMTARYMSNEELQDDGIRLVVDKTEKDQYDIFAKHVASQLRELPMRSFVLLQCQIQELITKERIMQLDAADIHNS